MTDNWLFKLEFYAWIGFAIWLVFFYPNSSRNRSSGDAESGASTSPPEDARGDQPPS